MAVSTSERWAYEAFRRMGYGAGQALEMARAEAEAREAGLHFEWADDPVGWGDVESDLRMGYIDQAPERVECAACLSEDGECLASLCGIEDADDDYRRVIEAELAMEALAQMAGGARLLVGDDGALYLA